ncbi:MAG: nodulation protein NfeD, partial [Chloroflexota bacterium]|nr:nodulation protein NfeD [Chloroflexota bacterium]
MTAERLATHLRRLTRLLFAMALAALLVGTAYGANRGQTVYVLPTSGVVDQIMAGYLHEGIAKAHREGMPAVIIELDTPGGSLESTHNIVKTLLDAPLPTIVWVGPPGSRAASAG